MAWEAAPRWGKCNSAVGRSAHRAAPLLEVEDLAEDGRGILLLAERHHGLVGVHRSSG